MANNVDIGTLGEELATLLIFNPDDYEIQGATVSNSGWQRGFTLSDGEEYRLIGAVNGLTSTNTPQPRFNGQEFVQSIWCIKYSGLATGFLNAFIFNLPFLYSEGRIINLIDGSDFTGTKQSINGVYSDLSITFITLSGVNPYYSLYHKLGGA